MGDSLLATFGKYVQTHPSHMQTMLARPREPSRPVLHDLGLRFGEQDLVMEIKSGADGTLGGVFKSWPGLSGPVTLSAESYFLFHEKSEFARRSFLGLLPSSQRQSPKASVHSVLTLPHLGQETKSFENMGTAY